MPYDNPPAFPADRYEPGAGGGVGAIVTYPGMTLHDWFAGQALSNLSICTGAASFWELTAWFGRNRTGITKAEIVAKQAGAYADAMLAARQGDAA